MKERPDRRRPGAASRKEGAPGAKKSLGQHFLTSSAYVRTIADAGEVEKGDAVLEIGPGRGALTQELLSRGAQVIAVEKDRALIPVLHELFAEQIAAGGLHLIEGDALNFDPAAHGLKTGRYKLIANIPYYITGALFERFLSGASQPSSLVFLIQKEVAERIARSKKGSLLSISIQAYGNPKYIKTVPRGAFSPAPTVDSAILRISDISRKNFASGDHEQRFFDILRAGFSHKRKLLVRNIAPVLGEDAAVALADAGIPEKARAEDISIEKWLVLAQK